MPDSLGLSKFFRSESEISHNTKLKQYPDGFNITVTSKPIFKEPGWVLEKEKPPKPKPKRMDGIIRADSIRRAKQKVQDIVRLNKFTWFITWTLDKREIDRYDPQEISRRLKNFLKNIAQRNAAIYLVIPEYHKDGALHMHGLLAGDFEMIDSGKKTKSGRIIYNMPQWKYGFSAAIELDGQRNIISRYITKYISKDFRKIFGAFYYAGGAGLVREPPTSLYDLEYADVNAKEYKTDYANFKYLDFYDDEETTNFITEHVREDNTI